MCACGCVAAARRPVVSAVRSELHHYLTQAKAAVLQVLAMQRTRRGGGGRGAVRVKIKHTHALAAENAASLTTTRNCTLLRMQGLPQEERDELEADDDFDLDLADLPQDIQHSIVQQLSTHAREVRVRVSCVRVVTLDKVSRMVAIAPPPAC